MRVMRSAEDSEGAPDTALLDAATGAARLSARRDAAAGPTLAAPPALLLDDEARARGGAIVDAVLLAAETALRAAEPLLDAAPAGDLPARFRAAGLLGASGLAAAALARAEEHRLCAALRRVAEADEEGPGAARLDPIGGTLAAESFAVRAAEAARLDRVGEPLLPLHDLAAEDRHAVLWQVAACLAEAVLALGGEARAGQEEALHRAAAAAVAVALATVDDGDGIAPAAMRLAHGIAGTDGIDDALVAGTLAAGRLATLAALLAVRVGIAWEEAHGMVGVPARAAVLLRACEVGRETAVAMLVTLALATDTGTGTDPAAEVATLVDGFDALPPERARAEVRRTRMEPAYRGALQALTRVRR